MEFDYSDAAVTECVPNYLEAATQVPLGSLRLGAMFVVYAAGVRVGGLVLTVIRRGEYGVGCVSEDHPGATVWLSAMVPVYAAVVLA